MVFFLVLLALGMTDCLAILGWGFVRWVTFCLWISSQLVLWTYNTTASLFRHCVIILPLRHCFAITSLFRHCIIVLPLHHCFAIVSLLGHWRALAVWLSWILTLPSQFSQMSWIAQPTSATWPSFRFVCWKLFENFFDQNLPEHLFLCEILGVNYNNDDNNNKKNICKAS